MSSSAWLAQRIVPSAATRCRPMVAVSKKEESSATRRRNAANSLSGAVSTAFWERVQNLRKNQSGAGMTDYLTAGFFALSFVWSITAGSGLLRVIGWICTRLLLACPGNGAPGVLQEFV